MNNTILKLLLSPKSRSIVIFSYLSKFLFITISTSLVIKSHPKWHLLHNLRFVDFQDISERVKKFRSDKSLAKVDISVVIIMSHGNNANIPGGYTEITGVDGKGVNTEDIVNEFTVEKCPALKEKPKIFIFQCCR